GGQRDERQVSHHQVDGAADRFGGELAGVGPLDDDYPRIAAQRPGQLPVPHVGGYHLGRPSIQQDLRESTGRSTRVQAAPTVNGKPERVQCADELVRATRHPTAFAVVRDRQRRGDGDGGTR